VSRLRLIGVTFPASTIPAAADPTTPPVQSPIPGDSAPTYPPTQPAAGSTVYDSGPQPETTTGGALPIEPSFAVPISVRRSPTARHDTELGYVSAYATTTTNRRGLELSWLNISKAQRDTLVAFFDGLLGNTPPLPFSWTPANEPAGVWSIVKGKYGEKKIAPNVYTMRAPLNEVL